ncbi:MAG: ATP-dependent sacrificial sulfur transferase LarE [Planctomycetota bacterium]|nr:ATP-dependent sacrificial sulfur transferase LarE [Planctomycetota bacterium]
MSVVFTDSQPRHHSVSHQARALVRHLTDYRTCTVALSGGVDSAVVAKAAHLALGDHAQAVTADSASLAEGELDQARRTAALIGIRHRVIQTREFTNPEYLRNAPDRCYHCKSELYQQLQRLSESVQSDVILSGTNQDDLTDFRPGIQAGREHQVQSPLADCKLGKQTVREIARYWELPVWDKPASPCLSSRIAYGVPVTVSRLKRIDQAERLLRRLGFQDVRVRCHQGDVARVEVAKQQIHQLFEGDIQPAIYLQLVEWGFRMVTFDLKGFQSGNLNQLIQIEL